MTDHAVVLTQAERKRIDVNLRPKDAATVLIIDRSAKAPRVLMGKHVPGIGLNQVYEQNTVPQLPGIKDAMRAVATEAA